MAGQVGSTRTIRFALGAAINLAGVILIAGGVIA